jgi:hypothetical protein
MAEKKMTWPIPVGPPATFIAPVTIKIVDGAGYNSTHEARSDSSDTVGQLGLHCEICDRRTLLDANSFSAICPMCREELNATSAKEAT